MSNTPETSAMEEHILPFALPDEQVRLLLDFASRLERERDEARYRMEILLEELDSLRYKYGALGIGKFGGPGA